MQSIANYEIIKTISETGPSSVFIAKHKKLERKTLLKVYSGGDQTLIERFEREAKIVADLNSDAIVSIYDFGEAEGKYFISMEFVEGQNLNDYLNTHKLSDEQIINFAYQITSSVAVLHNKGYIHRDLKPENILVDPDNKIKLTDFGITLHESLNRVTSDGALLGTPLYMSPEQINNLSITPASDMFALGIIFYQMATGKHPFEAPSFGEVFSKLLTYNPPSINTIRSSIPKWFSDLVDRLLHKEADKRPQGAQDIADIISPHIPKDEQIVHDTQSKSNKTRSLSTKWIFAIASIIVIASFYVYLETQKNNYDRIVADSLSTQQQIVSDIQDSLLINDRDISATDTHRTMAYVEKPNIVIDNHEIKPGKKNNIYKETTLLVNTYPWCDVYIDYRKIDQTPMAKPVEIRPGKYLLSLQNKSYPSLSDSIHIRPDEKNVFYYNLDSIFYRLDLHVTPWGKVIVDGKYVGTTPLQNPLYLTRDKHIVKITNEFYETWQDTIEWNGQAEIKHNIVLKEIK